jgi:anaerobic magnesium-protoporphyrin IX monomethyl ester cyclase
MMNKKILFITPPYHCGVVEVAGRWVPLTFVYLAEAVRRAGFEPVIYDAMTKQHGFAEIEERIRKEAPEYVATTAITSTAPDALKVLETAKQVDPRITTIIGGVHPSFLCNETFETPQVDYIVREEGEQTLPELLLALQSGSELADVAGIAYRGEDESTVTTGFRPFIPDLDSLGTAWDLIDWEDYTYFVIPDSRLAAVSTSRGCSHNCTFCSQQKFWRQSWRARSPENIVEEIRLLRNTYGVNVVLFSDEYPTQERDRWETLLDLLIAEDMGVYLLMETRPEDIVRDADILWKYRKAGIIHIYIGVEATDQETLDLIRKDISVQTGIRAIELIREHGMMTETSFILGFPHETKETIARTLELSKIYNPDFAHYLALAPWPYAEMYEDLRPHIEDFDYRKYNLIDPVIKPENITRKDVDWAIIDCYRSFYMGKLKEVLTITDPFVKNYMIHSMKLIMNCSFIVEKLGSLGKIPPQIQAVFSKISSVPSSE